MTHLTRLDQILGGECAIVETGADMAAVLAQACPIKARSFAAAMHERACAGHDETALAFWCDVLTSLASIQLRAG